MRPAEAASLAAVLGRRGGRLPGELLSRPATTFVYLKRQADVEVAAQGRSSSGLDGGLLHRRHPPRVPATGAIGGQVIGFCNVDGEGITGLELQYNDVLSGTPGTYTGRARRATAFPIPGGVQEETPAVDGQDIMISIDIQLQEHRGGARSSKGAKDI